MWVLKFLLYISTQLGLPQQKVSNRSKPLWQYTWLPHERAPCLDSDEKGAFRIYPPPLHALIFKSPKRSPRVFLKAVICISLSPFPIYQLFLPTHFLSFYFPLIPKSNSATGALFIDYFSFHYYYHLNARWGRFGISSFY